MAGRRLVCAGGGVDCWGGAWMIGNEEGNGQLGSDGGGEKK